MSSFKPVAQAGLSYRTEAPLASLKMTRNFPCAGTGPISGQTPLQVCITMISVDNYERSQKTKQGWLQKISLGSWREALLNKSAVLGRIPEASWRQWMFLND